MKPLYFCSLVALGSVPTTFALTTVGDEVEHHGNLNLIPLYRVPHGALMATAVLILFPLGAVSMRLFGTLWIHGVIQVLGLCTLLAGFGLGIKMKDVIGTLLVPLGKTHTVFGTVLVSVFLLQSCIGIGQHFLYRKTGGRTAVSHIHTWFGRIVLICAAVNGGLGLKLAANTKAGEIIFGVIAGVMALLYTLTVLVKRKSGKNVVKADVDQAS